MIVLTVGNRTLLAAPVLECSGRTRSLPDPEATVVTTPGAVTATWRDGITVRTVASRTEHGYALRTTVDSGAPDDVAALGVRLTELGANRILVDGYHSNDWAGLRDLAVPGAGWWGAIVGTPRAPSLAMSLLDPPAAGALRLRWRGDGTLDMLTTGEPDQLSMRTGAPTPLGPGTSSSDAVHIVPFDPAPNAGMGLPAAREGWEPGHRRSGWASWNCLGSTVSAAHLLAGAGTVQDGDVVLLDDGWMPYWGDWELRDDAGLCSLGDLRTALSARHRDLGVWMAPFLVHPRSALAAAHPEWLLCGAEGGRLFEDHRPPGMHHVLDASRDDVRQHLADLGERCGRLGIAVLKLDFLYAGASPALRGGGGSGVGALRAGMLALVQGYRAHAPEGAAVWASGAPAPPLVGLVDAARSGDDAVMRIPTAHAEPTHPPHFVHGPAILNSQTRNAAARSWLWGATVPPDVDAVTLGGVGIMPPVDDVAADGWLRLAANSGGPFLVSDIEVPEHRLRALAAAQNRVRGTPAVPLRPTDPLDGEPAPPDDDDFLAQPGRLAPWPAHGR